MRKKIHVKGFNKRLRKKRKNLQKQVLQYGGLMLCPIKQFKSVLQSGRRISEDFTETHVTQQFNQCSQVVYCPETVERMLIKRRFHIL
jgi:hypothetical protein